MPTLFIKPGLVGRLDSEGFLSIALILSSSSKQSDCSALLAARESSSSGMHSYSFIVISFLASAAVAREKTAKIVGCF